MSCSSLGLGNVIIKMTKWVRCSFRPIFVIFNKQAATFDTGYNICDSHVQPPLKWAIKMKLPSILLIQALAYWKLHGYDMVALFPYVVECLMFSDCWIYENMVIILHYFFGHYVGIQSKELQHSLSFANLTFSIRCHI